jgi:hypothetical protein
VLTCHTFFEALGQKGLHHQEQNREGGKAQSGQYMVDWVGLLHCEFNKLVIKAKNAC